MKLENQVCSLEQSKKLKELGVVQDSLFYHFPNVNTEQIKEKYDLPDYTIQSANFTFPKHYDNIRQKCLNGELNNTYSAFTASEILQMLGNYFTQDELMQRIKICLVILKNKFKFLPHPEGNSHILFITDLLINLVKREILKMEDINHRLTNS